jgi:hypothetical protein
VKFVNHCYEQCVEGDGGVGRGTSYIGECSRKSRRKMLAGPKLRTIFPNVNFVTCVIHVFRIRELSGLNLGPETGYPHCVLSWFYSALCTGYNSTLKSAAIPSVDISFQPIRH